MYAVRVIFCAFEKLHSIEQTIGYVHKPYLCLLRVRITPTGRGKISADHMMEKSIFTAITILRRLSV
jgi:hypothetical protein